MVATKRNREVAGTCPAPPFRHTESDSDMKAADLPNRDDLETWDREHFFHPSTHMAQHARGESVGRVITGGEGVYIVDRDGKKSLDAFAGLYCVNVGYGRSEIADAIAHQARELAYYHAYVGHGSEPAIRLARMIIERAPAGMSRGVCCRSGSDGSPAPATSAHLAQPS